MIEPADVVRTGLQAVAVGSLSMTLTRSRMFREVRWWIARERKHYPADMMWDLAKCPWCMSHWLSFITVAICGPLSFSGWWAVNWLLTSFLVVAIAPAAAFMIHRIYGPLPPVPTEAEWNGESQEEDHGSPKMGT